MRHHLGEPGCRFVQSFLVPLLLSLLLLLLLLLLLTFLLLLLLSLVLRLLLPLLSLIHQRPSNNRNPTLNQFQAPLRRFASCEACQLEPSGVAPHLFSSSSSLFFLSPTCTREVSSSTHITSQPTPLAPLTPHSNLVTESSVVVESIGSAVDSLLVVAGEAVDSQRSHESGMYPRSDYETEQPLPFKQNQKCAVSNQTKSTVPMSEQNFQNLEQREKVNLVQPQAPQKFKQSHGQSQTKKISKAQNQKNEGTLGPYEEHSNVPSAHEIALDPPAPSSGAAHNVDLGSETELDSPTRMTKENRRREEGDR